MTENEYMLVYSIGALTTINTAIDFLYPVEGVMTQKEIREVRSKLFNWTMNLHDLVPDLIESPSS